MVNKMTFIKLGGLLITDKSFKKLFLEGKVMGTELMGWGLAKDR